MADRKFCDQCLNLRLKTFASSGGLSLHKQTHSGKRYNCSQCNKSFSNNGSLKTHSLIHTGEKPNATIQPMLLPIYKSTFGNTLERNHMNAINATILQLNQANLSATTGPTLEKSHSSVTSATTLALLLVTCSST